MLDGAVAPGRRETVIGAHVEGHNRGTIRICLLGGFGSPANDLFEKNFTGAQAAAVQRLIGEIKRRTAIGRVSGHNEYAAKACPGFRVGERYSATQLRQPHRTHLRNERLAGVDRGACSGDRFGCRGEVHRL